MSKQVIQTDTAPAAVGPYSQGIVANGFVFTAGQVGLVPGTKDFAAGGVEAQARQALHNVQAILEAAGTTMDNIVKATVFLANMDDFAAVNGVYAEFFSGAPPARSAVQVARLPLDALVEIEVIALV